MWKLFDRAGGGNDVTFPVPSDNRRMWWSLGARAMKQKMLEDLTLWAVTCPNPAVVDDLWDFIRKARDINVRYEEHQ